MDAIKINKVTKSFGDLIAVDNVNLNIKEGEILGLLGPNGAGKTTLINIISGLLNMDEGEIRLLNEDIKKYSKNYKKNIGIVPQDIAVYEDLTAYENVKFFASLYGLRGNLLKERTAEALEFVGLLDKAKEYPKNFSGGMSRRLNIACAIAHKPKIIIMDEPTVGIDPQSRNHILQSIKILNRNGSTIIYTSHYMEEVEHLCSKVAIMDKGKIIAEGTKDELENLVRDKNIYFITVDSINNVSEKEIKEIKGVISVDIKENNVEVNSNTEINNLDKIILYFTKNNINIKNVKTKSPNLETVFLTLTGRKLRD